MSEFSRRNFIRSAAVAGLAATQADRLLAAEAQKPDEAAAAPDAGPADQPPVVVDAAEYKTLQAAFDALPATGGMVKLPPGTFEIHQPLYVTTAETRIEGSGAATHIKNVNQEGRPALVVQPPTRATDRRARLWRVQLGNFRISGNENSGDGIHAEGIEEIFIQGVSVDRHGGHGIYMEHCHENPRVADSMITYNKQAGLYLNGGHDIVVNANHFEENQDAVICVDGYNLCMNGNNLDDHLRHGVVIENTYGSVLSGNMIEECDGTAVILDRDCYGITISANVIAHDMGGGVDLRGAHGCAVSANTFTLVHAFGVRVAQGSGRITITGNNFCNSYLGEGRTKRPLENPNPVLIDIGTGIVLEDTRHVAVSGNSFSGLDGAAVRAVGKCGHVLVSGNVVSDIHRRPAPGDAKLQAFDISPESEVTLQMNLTE
ncbi:MAG: right-handed parallel beta-helix repeat-containing protein [Thermoguttaceae bacterium]|jgi:hypothetical protein|nr:right-handed parallel beta-helix repeat-containing protein [Thermoguttaceae bacterium]